MAKTLPNGFLVVFDGIDGCGKSTQLRLANDQLIQEGWAVQTTRIPGGTPIGEELRKAMLSPVSRPPETDMYIAAAMQAALIRQIAEMRQSGSIILMDRGPLSLAAYQIYGSGLDEALGWPLVDQGMKALTPDLTIVYRTDVKTALARAHSKSTQPDYFESKPEAFFERVAEGFESAHYKYEKVIQVDGNPPIEAVHDQTMKLIEAELTILS